MPPPAVFRAQHSEPTKVGSKRRTATFRDDQSASPKPKQQRTFGTDITNKACNARPVFKRGCPDETSELNVRPLELLKDPKKQATPIKFLESRYESDPQDVYIGSSPLAKPNASNAPLATLIEARCVELKTIKPLSDTVKIDIQEFAPYNAVCAMNSDAIIMNPRNIPLEHAQIHRYHENAYIAGLW